MPKPKTGTAAATGTEAVEPFQEPVPVVKADQAPPAGMVTVRVLPKGAGRIATGHHDPIANVFTYHEKGDHLFLPPDIAKTQEDAGLVEIVSGT